MMTLKTVYLCVEIFQTKRTQYHAIINTEPMNIDQYTIENENNAYKHTSKLGEQLIKQFNNKS